LAAEVLKASPQGRFVLAVRIYTLAKELKIDNKDMVGICTAAGVPGKAPLSSLSDDEVAVIKAYLSKGPKAVAAGPKITSAGKVEMPSDAGAVRREDYIAPTGTADKVPVLGPKPAKPSLDKKKKPGETGRSAGAVANFAPLPAAQQPSAAPKSHEPTPQKPELRLPIEALRANKPGSKPLSDIVKQHEQKKKQAAADAAPAIPGTVPAKPSTQRTKGKPKHEEVVHDVAARGKRPAAPGEVESPKSLIAGRELRQLQRKRATNDKNQRDDDDTSGGRSRRRIKLIRKGTNTAAPRKGKAVIELPCTVRGFSEAAGIPVQTVMRQLMSLGPMLAINSPIPDETAELLAVELGIEVEFKHPVDIIEEELAAIANAEDAEEQRVPRPPIVTFLGHVDHGKTSLLDRIIGTNVVAGESGGITQHIRAYQIHRGERVTSFVDTPGHEAFTEMRARGANVTDIAVLVVAADDGVMPQTEEAISHARAADVPIVVALNKIDLPGANIEHIYQQLATNDLLPSEWGGETEVVKTSATKGTGIDDLLDTLQTIADLHELKANPDRPAHGTCIEAELHEGRGVVAKFMVQNGTLKVGDAVVCGSAYGRVKAMYDTLRPSQQHQAAPPSMPVNITGLDSTPNAGEHFYVVSDIARAREIAEERGQRARRASLSGGPTHVTLENLWDRIQRKGEAQTLNIILRADVRGSIEAIRKELAKLEHPEVKLKILQSTVGAISEADVHLADASDAIIIGFNVVPDEGARALADEKGVQVRRYEIIYKISEDMRAALEGMLEPEEQSVELGRALVKRTFTISRIGTVAGCQVLSGNVQRNGRARVLRDGRVVGEYTIDTLKREKDDAKEVRQGLECGIKLANFNDLKEGDILEVFKIEEVARSL
jgi:translation initiation factor IF-2